MVRRDSVLHEGTARQGGQVVEMQRRRLLLAIGEVVGESGLESATVGRVCEQAGVSRRTFYELFADREACLLAAFDHATEAMRDRLPAQSVPNQVRIVDRLPVGLTGKIVERNVADLKDANRDLLNVYQGTNRVQPMDGER